mgnify:CR=1 FL=1
MISHKYKCIFIHIPRCAGTSVEATIADDDWWKIDKGTKHIIAPTAKRIYKDYWDDYFKFTIIRNPWSRLVSMTRYSSFYKVRINKTNELMDISKYKSSFPNIEIDPRSVVQKNEIDFSIHQSLYQNIIGSEMDYIAKFENIDEDLAFIYDKIKFSGKSKRFKCRTGRSDYDSLNYTKYYNPDIKEQVYQLYKNDIDKFNYKFGE